MRVYLSMAIKRRFGEKKGTAKHKGAKGQSYKKKDKNNKIKTKSKLKIKTLTNDVRKLQLLKQLRQYLTNILKISIIQKEQLL